MALEYVVCKLKPCEKRKEKYFTEADISSLPLTIVSSLSLHGWLRSKLLQYLWMTLKLILGKGAAMASHIRDSKECQQECMYHRFKSGDPGILQSK